MLCNGATKHEEPREREFLKRLIGAAEQMAPLAAELRRCANALKFMCGGYEDELVLAEDIQDNARHIHDSADSALRLLIDANDKDEEEKRGVDCFIYIEGEDAPKIVHGLRKVSRSDGHGHSWATQGSTRADFNGICPRDGESYTFVGERNAITVRGADITSLVFADR